MITLKNLPPDYKPYKKLKVCSNTMEDGGHIVSIGEVLPLIIGTGTKPQIWLQALVNAKSNDFMTIVDASIPTHPAVKVSEIDGVMVIKIQGEKVLTIKSTSPNSAEVTQLNFRPIGLNVTGDSSGIEISGSTFSRNTMSGGGVFISLGG